MASAPALEISEIAARDIAFLARHLDEVDRVLDAVRGAPLPPTFSEVFDHLAQQSALPESQVRQIVRAVMNFDWIRQRLRKDPESVFEMLTDAMDRREGENAGWSSGTRTAWLAAKERIAAMMTAAGDDNPLMLLQKTTELTYAYQNVLHDARILTDIRPVFRTDAGEVVKAVVLHKLLIEYSDGRDGHRRIELALDASDVSDLRKQCQRAELKASVIARALKEIAWDTVVPRQTE